MTFPDDEAPLPPGAATALTTPFGLPEDAAAAGLAALRRLLTARIAELLATNPAWLMHVLYRVDVAEARVKAVFAEAASEDIAPRLADLLIERQLQKIAYRRRYPGGA